MPKPNHCQSCIGHSWGNDFTRVTGENRVPLLLVGESSGRSEAKKGEPFVGAAGQVLEKAIRMSGLSRSDYSISNLLRCSPPSNELLGTPYEFEALAHCRKYLNETVAERRPSVILALGQLPLRELSKAHVGQDLRGYFLPSIYEGVSVIGTYHPSRILRGDWHLFGVLCHDLRVASRAAQRGLPQPIPTQYNLRPTTDDLSDWLERVRSQSSAVSYDLETAELLIKNPPEPRRIIQMQFSSAVGEAVVVGEQQFDFAREVFLLSSTKYDYNGRLFDRPVLRAAGFDLNGEYHDVMEMYAHTQSGFVSNKDDAHGDKGVPSRLMSLQSCLSFWYPTFRPWKSVKFPQWSIGEPLPLPVRLYGARDSDATIRCALKLRESLTRIDLWDGYYTFKHQLGKVLDDLSEHGLPVDRQRQNEVRIYIGEQQAELQGRIQSLVPDELKPFKAFKSWPRDLREAVKASGQWKPKTKPLEYEVEAFGYARRNGVLIKPLPFNLNSSRQLLAYISHMGYRIPLHLETDRPTTGKNEIEQLVAETDDAVLKLTQRVRKLTKLGGTYCGGDWIPGDDGRVHGEFRFGTASGQTSCSRPNIQQYPEHYDAKDEWVADIMKRVKGCIKAEESHIFAKIDYRAAHARCQGHLAEDENYYRLADTDIHSYTTAHYVGVPDKDTLLELDDESLRKRLREIKKQYEYDRNYKLKRILYLMQFTGGAEKAFQILSAGFVSVIEVQQLMDMIKGLFPKTFIDFPANVEKQLKQQPWLVSQYKHRRFFWDGDLQQATSFLPSNCFHAHAQSALLRLQEQGAFAVYGACNWAHDSLWLHCREELVDEGIAAVKTEFEKPSDVLVNSLGPFWCHADAMKGYSMDKMVEV